MENSNLIRLVDGKACPCPSAFSYGLMDVSGEDAGRVQDGNDTMYKNRTSQKRKIDLQWLGTNPEETSKILKLFNPEYIMVTYHDAMDNEEQTREFYVGDRTAPVQQWFTGGELFTSVSFNIVER